MPQSPSPDRNGQDAPKGRGVALFGIVIAAGFIAYQGPFLWSELSALRRDLARTQDAAVVGYLGISPEISTAERPSDWYRIEDDEVLIWAGWDPERGHRWFRTEAGDLDADRIGEPIGRDILRAIDRPLVEVGGGPISGRIPPRHIVESVIVNGQSCAYPSLILGKVHVVNDRVARSPFLVVRSLRSGEGSSIYEATIGGRRVSMGLSGLVYAGRPLLYDRETEGLWMEVEAGLVALSGPHRGARLERLGRAKPSSWASWSDRHTDGRIVVGALRDRDDEGASLGFMHRPRTIDHRRSRRG